MEPKLYWVGFSLIKGIGAVRLQILLNAFGSLETAWNASSDSLRSTGLPEKVVENVLRMRNSVDLEHVFANYQQQGINVVTWDEDAYPRRLKEISQPPPVLYVRGEILPEDDFAVAVVGTRRVTVYGRQVAAELGTFLAQNQITLVSGLARGVDAIAHDACLNAGGRTFAVLGSGVDRIYPPENRQLAERVIKQGAIISDYAPGTPPEGVNFPPRNRIISGFSMAVVVVEASDQSGALITAAFAADQSRDVLAVPGNINAPQSKGTNLLIQQGARPLLKMEDVLDALELEQVSSKQAARTLLPADKDEACLMRVLSSQPLHIDEIGEQSNLSIEKVSATLTIMELKGMVRQVGGMNYVLARETRAAYGDQYD